jgi:hypothetical protein
MNISNLDHVSALNFLVLEGRTLFDNATAAELRRYFGVWRNEQQPQLIKEIFEYKNNYPGFEQSFAGQSNTAVLSESTKKICKAC